MANIVESETWDTGVYQLETTDPVQGGVDGIDNIPHKALANRTVWLKTQLALKALLGGDNTQLFKAADGLAADDVVTKGQLDLKVNTADTDVLATANKIPIRDVDKAISGKNQCTAWVVFDGQTTPPTIKDSFNVASVTDIGSNYFEVAFLTDMADINYSVSGSCVGSTSSWSAVSFFTNDGDNTGNTVSSFTGTFRDTYNGAYIEHNNVCIQVFGGK